MVRRQGELMRMRISWSIVSCRISTLSVYSRALSSKYKRTDHMRAFIVCVLLAVTCSSVQGQACSGLPSGGFPLPDLNHNVSGNFYIENDKSYCIEDFYYDGAGPDAFLYLYYPGDPPFIKGGGVITPVPGQERVQFEVGRRYLGERFRFSPPEGHRTCDYGSFGIWCRYASQLFTIALNLETHFDAFSCTPSPGRAFLGSLPQANNGISGDLFAVTDKMFSIRSFTYDGQAGDSVFFYFFRIGVTPDPTSNTGIIIPVTALSAQAVNYTAITIPNDMDVSMCDLGAFTIWDRNRSTFLAQVNFGTEQFTNNPALADHDRSLVLCDRPSTRPGALVGELNSLDHGVEGTLYVQDDKTFYIQLFSYDARGTGAYLYYYREGQTVEDTGHGYRIDFSPTMGPLPTGTLNSYKKFTPFVVDLNNAADETTVNTCDVSWFTIWSEEDQSHYTTIEIPQSLFTTDSSDPGIAAKTKVVCSPTTAIPTPRTGGATPTVSFVSATAAVLMAIITMLF